MEKYTGASTVIFLPQSGNTKVLHNYERGWSRDLKKQSGGSKNGSNIKDIRLSKIERRWQTNQEKMIKAERGERSHVLKHSRPLDLSTWGSIPLLIWNL